MTRYAVARASDVPDGDRIIVDVNGRSIGVYNIDGAFYALLNRCPHQGAELCKGAIVSSLTASRPGEFTFDSSRKFVACPWHGWEFDVKTGQSYFDPDRTRVRPYPVEVQSGEGVATALEGDSGTRLVKGPYMAESVQVSVEDEYIIVTMPGR